MSLCDNDGNNARRMSLVCHYVTVCQGNAKRHIIEEEHVALSCCIYGLRHIIVTGRVMSLWLRALIVNEPLNIGLSTSISTTFVLTHRPPAKGAVEQMLPK